MTTMTYSYARQHLNEAMKKACDDHAPIIVTNKDNNHVVIMSLEDYESFQETEYLLRSPKNAARLLASIKQIESGKGKTQHL